MLVIFFETKKRSIFKTFRKRFRVAWRAFRLAQNRVHRISHIKDTYRKKILPQPAQICAGKKTIGIPAAKNIARRYLNLQASQPQRLKSNPARCKNLLGKAPPDTPWKIPLLGGFYIRPTSAPY